MTISPEELAAMKERLEYFNKAAYPLRSNEGEIVALVDSAAFINYARHDMARLIAEVERLDSEVNRLTCQKMFYKAYTTGLLMEGGQMDEAKRIDAIND